jgi:hypothetical protein
MLQSKLTLCVYFFLKFLIASKKDKTKQQQHTDKHECSFYISYVCV